jgi:uncharacterized membrane protein
VALRAAAFGALVGMRSMSPPALLARRLARGRAARMLAVFAAGELLADKTPGVPARIIPLSLFGRAASGALGGAALAGHLRQPRLGPALAGSAAAVASAFAAYHLRRLAGERTSIPDALFGLLEDAVVLAAGTLLARTVE